MSSISRMCCSFSCTNFNDLWLISFVSCKEKVSYHKTTNYKHYIYLHSNLMILSPYRVFDLLFYYSVSVQLQLPLSINDLRDITTISSCSSYYAFTLLRIIRLALRTNCIMWHLKLDWSSAFNMSEILWCYTKIQCNSWR